MKMQQAQDVLHSENTIDDYAKANYLTIAKSETLAIQTLKEIWSNKEYRVFPKNILRYMRQDKELSDAAIICWQTLFELAYFDEEWKVEISKAEIGKEMGKSSSTVSRLLEQLEKQRYIEIQHNRINQVWQVSTIAVRFPQRALQHLLNNPNRNKGKVKPNIKDVPHRTFLSHEKEDIEGIKITNEVLISAEEDPYHNFEDRVIPKVEEGLSVFEPSNNIISEIKKENNNKTAVVVNENLNEEKKDENELAIQTLESQIAQLEILVTEANAAIREEQDKSKIIDRLRRYGEVSSECDWKKTRLEVLKKTKEKESSQKKLQNHLTQDPGFIQNESGVRQLSNFTFKRLMRTLEDLGFQGNQKTILCNEIVFEVRFGSLVNCSRTQQPLSVDHAVNIALKLVKEKRWSAPTALQQFITKSKKG